MSRSRHTEAQIIGVLKQLEAGRKAEDVAREGANGAGTIFQITSDGTLMTLYSFCSQATCADGETPVAGLVQATDGALYGTTELGGANASGTIFRISPTSTLTTLYSFCAQTNCGDGGNTLAGLAQGTDGDFYGAASSTRSLIRNWPASPSPAPTGTKT
jgi:uncharacterized repeat protein (TIGR03803 family)